MAVVGVVHPKKYVTNAGAKPGDKLILTKPLGTGIITTAAKDGIAKKSDLDEALTAADRMFPIWRDTPAIQRAQVLNKAAQLIRERIEPIGRILTMEQGKTLPEAKAEVVVSAEILEWYAGECMRSYGRIIPGRTANSRGMVLKEPIGPVAAFTPWNFPAYTPMRKMAAALAAGCSVIIKASEETPGTCVALARCFQEAGLPDGLLRVLMGDGETGAALVEAGVDKISFTGSVATGRKVGAACAERLKKSDEYYVADVGSVPARKRLPIEE